MLGRLKKKKKRKKKKKMEKITVFPFYVYNSYFRQFVSVIGYIDIKSSRLGRVQAFPMYGGLGMSAPSLHRVSTDSLIHEWNFLCCPRNQDTWKPFTESKMFSVASFLANDVCSK